MTFFSIGIDNNTDAMELKLDLASEPGKSLSFKKFDQLLNSFSRFVTEKSCTTSSKVLLEREEIYWKKTFTLNKLEKGVKQGFVIPFEKNYTSDMFNITIPIVEGKLDVYSVFSTIMASEVYHHFHHVITPGNTTITITVG